MNHSFPKYIKSSLLEAAPSARVPSMLAIYEGIWLSQKSKSNDPLTSQLRDSAGIYEKLQITGLHPHLLLGNVRS